MKKILFLLLTCAAFAACNDDDTPGIRYATENDLIENGHLTGSNMHFYGTSTVIDAQGKTFTDTKAWFEFAGGSEDFALYMHKTRFAAAMPGVEMRMYSVPYTPSGVNALVFSEQELIPDALRDNAAGGGSSYQPVERYKITGLEGWVNGIDCRVSFTCAGVYKVTYEGRMIIK